MKHPLALFMAMEPMVGPRAVVTLALETDDNLIAADSGRHRQRLRHPRPLATGLRRRSTSSQPATSMVHSPKPMAVGGRRPRRPSDACVPRERTAYATTRRSPTSPPP